MEAKYPVLAAYRETVAVGAAPVLPDAVSASARLEAMRTHPSSFRPTAVQRPPLRLVSLMRRRRSAPLPTSPGLPAYKLDVFVGLDSELLSALIGVRGAVTADNLGALYAVVRRTNSFLTGMEIVLDLSGTTADAVVLESIRASVRTGILPPASDPAGAPCRLRIIDPAPAGEIVAA